MKYQYRVKVYHPREARFLPRYYPQWRVSWWPFWFDLNGGDWYCGELSSEAAWDVIEFDQKIQKSPSVSIEYTRPEIGI